MLAWRCCEYRALPAAGGIHDQNAITMLRMRDAQRSWEILRQAKTGLKALSERDPEGFKFAIKVDALLEERDKALSDHDGH